MIEKVLCKNDYGKHNKCVGYCGGECVSNEDCPYQESINSNVVYGKYNYNTVADKLSERLINYFGYTIADDYVSGKFACRCIKEITEKFKREYKNED